MTFPGESPAIRARLEDELTSLGPVALHTKLATLDPVAAASILPASSFQPSRAAYSISGTAASQAAAPRIWWASSSTGMCS